MNIQSVSGLTSDLVIEVLKEKTKGQNPLESLKLKDNQILIAKVLKVFSQSQAQLLIAGQKLTATTRMPLSENETLVLKVARSEGKQILRRVEAAPVSQQSEGISEMRALGREGPYARLSDILNTSLPGELPEPTVSDAVPSDLSLDKGLPPSFKNLVNPPAGDQIKTPQPLSSGMEKTIDRTWSASVRDMVKLPSGDQIKIPQPLSSGMEKTIDKTWSAPVRDMVKLPSGDQIKTPQPLSSGMEKTIDKTWSAPVRDMVNTPFGDQAKTSQPLTPEIDKTLDKNMTPTAKDLIASPSGEQIETPQPLSPGMEKTIDKTMASSLKDLASPPTDEQIKTSQNLNPGVEKTISPEKASAPSFVQNPKIPFEFKLALLVLEKPVNTQPSLEKPLAALTRELVNTFSSQPETFKSNQTGFASEPLSARLEQSVKHILDALPPEEKNMARQFVESKAQPWEAKMAQVLLSGDSNTPSETVATLRNMLMDIAKGNAGGDDAGVRRSMIIENNPGPVSIEEPPLPLDTAAKSSPVPAAPQTAPGSPLILKEQADSLLKQDGKADFLPGAKTNVDLPQVQDQSEVALTNANKKSSPLSLIPREDNPTYTYGKEVLSDKTAITKPLPPTPAFRNDEPEILTESQPSANIKRDLENIFTRLENSLEKQTGIFDHESTQTMVLIKKIKDLISSFTLRPEKPFDESTVKNLVRDSGLMWENKLKALAVGLPGKKGELTQEQTVKLIENDVKALALKGMNPEDGVKHNVSETLKTFTESLEKMQVLNSQSSDDSGKYLLPLPYVHDGHIRFGQLLIDLDRKQSKEGEEKDRIIRVAFILDMSRLGPIQAGVSLYKKSMSGEFLVGNAEVKSMMDAALPGLVDELAQKGYTVKKMECRLSDPETLAGTNLVEKLVDPRDGSVSIRI